LWVARPSCFKLFAQLARAAASLTFCTAGNNSPIKIAMIAITTNNSINVNANLFCMGKTYNESGANNEPIPYTCNYKRYSDPFQ
jgi:hypothetical protein